MESLSKTQLVDLLRAAKLKRERDWLMILVAYSHGLRATEVVSLTPENFADGYVTVQRLKGSRRTTQPLVKSEEPLLSEVPAMFDWVKKSIAGQRLFPITKERFWQIVQEHGATAGIPKHLRHPHILKHTIAMHTIKLAGIENVRQWLGHENISSTGEYLKVDDEAAAVAVGEALRL